MKKAFFGFIMLIVIGLILSQFLRIDRIAEIPGENTDIRVLTHFTDSLKSAVDLKILEGLPHQRKEADLLNNEKDDKDVILLYEHYYYDDHRIVPQADALELKEALCSKGSIVAFRGLKPCGGYHPDYAILWTDANGAVFTVAICFGCDEVKMFGANKKLYADIATVSYDKGLKKILDTYKKYRPDYMSILETEELGQ